MGADISSEQNMRKENNQIIVNKNFLKSVSENINSQISNTVLKDAKACSADINNNQSITINKINTKGDFVFNSTQKQTAALTFSCIQITNVRNTAASNIATDMKNNLASNATSEALSVLETKAAQDTKVGFGASAKIKSTQNDTQISNYESSNDTHKEITNVLKNIVENNFSSETISKCISQVNNNQNLTLQEINIEGKAVIAIDQTQAADVISECIQKSDVGGDIINAAATAFDVKVVDEASSKSTQKLTSTMTQKTTAEGLMPASGAMGGCVLILVFICMAYYFNQYKIPISICCVLIIISLLVILYLYMKEKAKKENEQQKK
jgi:hypothetical protein